MTAQPPSRLQRRHPPALLLVAPVGLPGGAASFAAARRAAGQWNFASVGIGSVRHPGLELLQGGAGFSATHVPDNGNPAALTALVAGQVQGALVAPGLALPRVRAGRLRAVGLSGGRSVQAPRSAAAGRGRRAHGRTRGLDGTGGPGGADRRGTAAPVRRRLAAAGQLGRGAARACVGRGPAARRHRRQPRYSCRVVPRGAEGCRLAPGSSCGISAWTRRRRRFRVRP